MKKDTQIAHAGRDPRRFDGAVNTPVYRASTITFDSVAALERSNHTPYEGVRYGRYGTPSTQAFEEAVAVVEGGWRSIATSSGLSAITHALLAFLTAGDHLLMVDTVYFPTRRFCDTVLAGFGIETTYYAPDADIAALMRPRTRVVFAETPGSLTFEMMDVAAASRAAHAHGAVLLLDNTWGVLNFQPFRHGVDVSIQAATKYIVGHSDAMLGTITTTEEHWHRVKASVAIYGNNPGSEECFLGLRGLRSLRVRLEQHQRAGLELARWLAARPEVARVLHPALPGDPGHALWQRDFAGACGLFGVVLAPAPKAAVAAMLDGLEHFGLGYSWGGYESLVIPADGIIRRTVTPWQPEGPCLRLHVGLEDVDDLKDDLDRGFARLRARSEADE